MGASKAVAVVILLAAGRVLAAEEAALERSAASVDRTAQVRRAREQHARLVADQVTSAFDVRVRVELTAADRAALRGPRSRAGRFRVGVVKPLGAVVDFSDLPPGRLEGVRPRPLGAIRGTPSGGYVWTAVVASAGAGALRLHLENLRLPDGAALWVYDLAGRVGGPYTGAGPSNTSELWTHTVPGSMLVLQLEVSADARGRRAPSFAIAGVGHLEPGFMSGTRPAPAAGGNLCDFNAACVENASCSTIPAAIQDARDAVALIEFVSGAFLFTCTGGLLADTDAATQIPYFLTANHCLDKANEANSVEAFFQFSTTCGGACVDPDGVVPSTLGSDVMATDKGTDFTLLRLDESAPAGSAFLGWTSTPIAFTNGVPLFRISHPSGAPQAYSEHVVDTTRGTCQSWPRGDRIYSSDVFGATEGGSSGSPVLNAAGQVVGQLSGACGTNVNDSCDAVSNATVDGAFAAYFAEVQAILDPAPPPTTSSTSTTSSSSTAPSSSTTSSSTSTSASTSSSTSSSSSSSSSTSTTSSTAPTSSSTSSSSTTSSSTSTSTSTSSSTSSSSSSSSSSTSTTGTTSSSSAWTTSSTTSTSTSTSTPTTTTLPQPCNTVPIDGCRTARKAALAVKERRAGNEHLVFVARRFGAGLPHEAFGDPVDGTTAYRLCIYDAAARLVGRLEVDRGGGVCGAAATPCWKTLDVGGYGYRDDTASADGVTRLAARAGTAGKGAVRLRARNAARKAHASLPTGIAAALESQDRATVQLVTSDAGCMSVVFDHVQKADGSTFKAKRR